MRIAIAIALAATMARAQAPDTSAMKRPMDPENPTAFLILHKSELRLADSQVTQLSNIGAQLTLTTRPLKDSLDDLKPSGRAQPASYSAMTPEQRDSVLATRRAYARVLGELHDASRTAREQSIALLTPDQQKKLASLNENLAMESRFSKPAINQRAGPPGTASGAGTRPY
jgi:Spy/CpxP family protein refolding chaperone